MILFLNKMFLFDFFDFVFKKVNQNLNLKMRFKKVRFRI